MQPPLAMFDRGLAYGELDGPHLEPDINSRVDLQSPFSGGIVLFIEPCCLLIFKLSTISFLQHRTIINIST